MNNATEIVRIEATEDSQGGMATFDWTSGTMSIVWDNGATETWSRRGASIESKAESFFLFTGQIDRYQNAVRA